MTSVTLHSHIYDYDADIIGVDGYAWTRPYAAAPSQGQVLFSLLNDWLLEVEDQKAGIASVSGVAPGSAGNLLMSDGTNWTRSHGNGVTALLDALTVTNTVTAAHFVGDGSGLTGLPANNDASALTTGTLPSGRLVGTYGSVTGVGTLGVLTVTGTSIFGTDPGGSEPNRWGGAARFGANVIVGTGATVALSVGSATIPTVNTVSHMLVGHGGGLLANTTEADLTFNAYYNTGWKRLGPTFDPIRIAMGTTNGQLDFMVAGSGAADSAISWITTWSLTSAGFLVPGADVSYDFGAPTLRLRNLYSSGVLAAQSTIALTVGNNNTGDYPSAGYNWRGASSGYVYERADTASWVKFVNGGFSFFTAPTGTIGATISPTTVAQLTQAGVFILGTDPGGSYLMRVGGSITGLDIYASDNYFTGTSGGYWAGGVGSFATGWYNNAAAFTIRSGSADKLQVDAPTTAGNTSLLLYSVDTGAVTRVKTTASQTALGVTGRFLYM